MGNLNLGWPATAIVLSAVALAACTTSPGPETRAAPPQPEMPAKVRPSEVIGRWGYAAYHKPEDRARTEANARGQCKQPFVIAKVPVAASAMYLADSTSSRSFASRVAARGRDYWPGRRDTGAGP
jgi:hypothetical protein